jgi:hypothetical protein
MGGNMLKRTTYQSVKWFNYFDSAATDEWKANYMVEYRDTWPNHRPEVEPVAKQGETLNTFTLRGLTGGQLAHVDGLHGGEKLREIVAYGVTDWSGLYDGDKEIKPAFTKDGNGDRLASQSIEFLGFFGFPDLSLINMVAVQILSISRSLKS